LKVEDDLGKRKIEKKSEDSLNQSLVENKSVDREQDLLDSVSKRKEELKRRDSKQQVITKQENDSYLCAEEDSEELESGESPAFVKTKSGVRVSWNPMSNEQSKDEFNLINKRKVSHGVAAGDKTEDSITLEGYQDIGVSEL
jgi:hypothetical protein